MGCGLLKEYSLYKAIRNDSRKGFGVDTVLASMVYEKFINTRIYISEKLRDTTSGESIKVLYNKDALYLELYMSSINELYMLKDYIVKEKVYEFFFTEATVIKLILEEIMRKEKNMRDKKVIKYTYNHDNKRLDIKLYGEFKPNAELLFKFKNGKSITDPDLYTQDWKYIVKGPFTSFDQFVEYLQTNQSMTYLKVKVLSYNVHNKM